MCRSPWGRDHIAGNGRLGVRRFWSTAWGNDSVATPLTQTVGQKEEDIQTTCLFSVDLVGGNV